MTGFRCCDGFVMNYLRTLLEDPRGTGADRQVAVYQQGGSMQDLIQYLMQQTMRDIPVEGADFPSNKFLEITPSGDAR